MKAAIVLGAGRTPVYGEFSEPVASPGEQRIAVTAAAMSSVAKSLASGAHYSSSGRFPFVAGFDGVGRLSMAAGSILPCRERPTAAWANGPSRRQRIAWLSLTGSMT